MLPSIRAKWAQDSLTTLERLTPSERQSATARIRPRAIDEIAGAFAMGWLDVALLVEVDDAIRAAMGGERYLQHCREAIYQAFEWPLLSPMVGGARRVLGMGPGSLLRIMPRAFQLVTRHCGVLRTQVTRDSAILRYTSIPEVIQRSLSFQDGVTAAALACLGNPRLPARFEIDKSRLADGALRMTLNWPEGRDRSGPPAKGSA